MPSIWGMAKYQWSIILKTPESPLDSKEIKPVSLKGDKPWIFPGRMMLKLKLQDFEHLIWTDDLLENPWCWERLRAEGEEGIGGWDSWTASLMQWTWTWANSGRRWGIGRPGVLQSVGSQRVGHDWTTEQQQQLILYNKVGQLKNVRDICFIHQ